MDNNVLNRLFRESRTVNYFSDKEVTDNLIKELYDLTKMAPTAFNAQPARFLFLKSKEAKAKLKPFLSEGNIEKTMAAPVTVIVATDYDFYKLLHKTFPVADVKGYFEGNQPMIDATAFRNGTLSGGYLTIAARSLGLDVGPMSGFDNAGVDSVFFEGTNIKSNFLMNLGFGIAEGTHPRLERLSFDEVAKII
jgi:3-hydroxypropanoate dehydrogenase